MKKTMKVLLICLIASILGACSELPADNKDGEGAVPAVNNVKTLSVSTGRGQLSEYYKDTYDELIGAEYSSVYLNHGDELLYAELSEALDKKNASLYANAKKIISENKAFAAERYEQSKVKPYPLEASEEAYVRRADEYVISVQYFNYSYLGGTHGYYTRTGENYDTKSGRLLKLSEVVTDEKAFKKAVYDEIMTVYADDKPTFMENFDKAAGELDKLDFTLDYNGITVYFQPYVLGSYAEGIHTVLISNTAYPELIKEEYKKIPSSYGVELQANAVFYYDLDGDGAAEAIQTDVMNNEENMNGKISVKINGAEFVFEEMFYDAELTFVHMSNGKNYLYAELTSENDARRTLCFELSRDVKRLEIIPGGMHGEYRDGKIRVRDALTSPEEFYIEKRTQQLSTVEGKKKYRVSENGLPESDERLFRFDEGEMPEFTLLCDFEADIYDENKGKVTGKRVLKKGEKVLYYASDDANCGYLKCEDGVILEVNTAFETEKGFRSVNGKNIDEVFDGTMYAG